MSPAPPPSQVPTLAVVAGGAGSRMGGPKHQLRIGATPILESLLTTWNWSGPTILVLADTQPVPGQHLVSRIATDTVPNQGPLRGVLTALEACTTDRLIAVPIDMPNLRREHFDDLVRFSDQSASSECIFLRRQSPDGWWLEPFPALYRSQAAGTIRTMLDSGRRAFRELAGLPGSWVVDAPESWDGLVWTNLNTPEDLGRLEKSSDASRTKDPRP